TCACPFSSPRAVKTSSRESIHVTIARFSVGRTSRWRRGNDAANRRLNASRSSMTPTSGRRPDLGVPGRGPPGAGKAAVRGTDVVARAEPTDGTPVGAGEPFLDQLTDHRDEGGVRPGGAGPHHRQPELPGGLRRLDVEVVEDLHVI